MTWQLGKNAGATGLLGTAKAGEVKPLDGSDAMSDAMRGYLLDPSRQDEFDKKKARSQR